jgi:hypothetical protein
MEKEAGGLFRAKKSEGFLMTMSGSLPLLQ